MDCPLASPPAREYHSAPRPIAAQGAGLAQLVERLICNQDVGGSSPSTGTIKLYKINKLIMFPCEICIWSLAGVRWGSENRQPTHFSVIVDYIEDEFAANP